MDSELDLVRKDMAECERTITEVLRWQAEHDGRINAWWEQQFKFNADMMIRVNAVERRVIWASGFAAGVGALIGVGVSSLWV